MKERHVQRCTKLKAVAFSQDAVWICCFSFGILKYDANFLSIYAPFNTIYFDQKNNNSKAMSYFYAVSIDFCKANFFFYLVEVLTKIPDVHLIFGFNFLPSYSCFFIFYFFPPMLKWVCPFALCWK